MQLYDVNTERATLGLMLLSPEVILESIDTLEPGDFYSKPHQVIYQNICDLVQEGKQVDLITLTARLTDQDELLKIGGVTYLTTLTETVPISENIESYIEIIKQKSDQRKIWAILDDTKLGKLGLEDAVSKITDLSLLRQKPEVSFRESLIKTTELFNNGVAYKFQIPLLNSYLGGGIDRGELCTIGAFTSNAKTSLAIQFAIDWAKSGNTKVLYCSSEMSEQEINRRILSNQMPKNVVDLRAGRFNEGEYNAIRALAEDIGSYWQMNVSKVYDVNDIKKLVRKYKPDILFVDYLQNLDRAHSRSDYERTTSNIRDLQSLTLQNDLATFVISQLSRNKEVLRPPHITDLRDSGRIEECSNIILLLYWEQRMKLTNKMRSGGEPPEDLEVNIVKNRDGGIGRFILKYFPEYSIIREEERENNL